MLNEKSCMLLIALDKHLYKNNNVYFVIILTQNNYEIYLLHYFCLFLEQCRSAQVFAVYLRLMLMVVMQRDRNFMKLSHLFLFSSVPAASLYLTQAFITISLYSCSALR